MPVSTRALQQMAIYLGIVSGGGCAAMYYLIQQTFAKSEYYKLAIEELKKNDIALDALGAPPLQIRNIKLTNRNNRVDGISARIIIPVCGNKSAGYLHTYCIRDTVQKRWFLQEAILQLLDGQHFSVFSVTKDEDQS
ncbi:cytochrome c oxidase assembly factor 1 homolog [Leucoraja erinacea]|uniref:cytochrome c oxidase assembly factor 1 homolog n=1 Tax=Leucoraja erinaceus TaxID=7782 RepID=UPI0024539E82|nr:cytochrome c oxidase assembly factor 1 homolog [Leucoraja erinacea]XP_055512813.1 cytochrome c oxidase assembly factor 1 homolog [Leucoraja erinacea]XP_055512822.1 cytochrome c oxidase assembly factor 1 homolog [Leucoraja erinacea]XP_055512831.1 cytochrome c oxidase assembly factor 1 homolog [Leucoraja erinacea]XP_055512840.1 cytochrome c oxidase assembly factor 1 homolog [Leucoraja erinacea]